MCEFGRALAGLTSGRKLGQNQGSNYMLTPGVAVTQLAFLPMPTRAETSTKPV
jgi:hypothetical protein